MALSREKLSHTELFQLKWLTGEAMALISLWTVFYLNLEGAGIILAAMAVILAALVFPSVPGRIPRWMRSAFTPVLVVVVVTDVILSGSDFIPPLARMIVWLITYRALEYRKRRHDLQLVLLTLFMVIVTGVLTMELSFAVQILLYTPTAMLVLFLVTLSEGFEKKPEVPDDPWNGFSWKRLIQRIRQVLDRKMLIFCAALFAGTAATTSIIFITLPRFQLAQALPFLKMRTQQSLSGFSERVEFGDLVDILEDRSVAMRVDVPDNAPPESPYWRMVALDEYQDGAFQQSRSANGKNRIYSNYRFETPNGQAGDNGEWTFYFEGGISRYLPSPGNFREIRFQHAQRLVLNPRLKSYALTETLGNVLFYQLSHVASDPAIGFGDSDSWLKSHSGPNAIQDGRLYPATTLALNLSPEEINYLREVVTEITSNPAEESPFKSAAEFATSATQWLQKDRSYSLRTELGNPSGDRLVSWIRRKAPGHCELFAGSMVLIARAAGYPSRMITGFRGGDWNGYENYFMVRNSHAHAWVEIFDHNEGWLRIDPTPGAPIGLDGSLQANESNRRTFMIDRTLSAYLDSLRVLWYRRIVNFDQSQQREIVDSVRSRLAGLKKAISTQIHTWKEAISQLIRNPANLTAWSSIFRWLGWLIAISGSLVIWRQLRKRSLTQKGKASNMTRQRAGKWLLRLKKIPDSESASEVISELLTIRYGSENIWKSPGSVFRRARRVCRHSGNH